MSYIQVYDNILSKETCDDIIKFFEESPDRNIGSIGHERVVVKSRKDSIDLGLVFSIPKNEKECKVRQDIFNALNICTKRYVKKYPHLDHIDSWNVTDSYNIQKYNDGGGYHKMHCENEGGANLPRMLVWMIYLNNAKCGTRFYYPTRDVRARRGRVVIWPAFWTHPHSGITPNKGDKYIITGWYSHN